MAKIRNFDSLGAVFPHFCPDKREIWHGSGPSLPPCQISLLSGQRVAASAGRKTYFGPLSKTILGHLIENFHQYRHHLKIINGRPARSNLEMMT